MDSKSITAGTTGQDAAMRSITNRNKVWIVFGAGLGLACGFGPFFFSVAGVFLKPLAASFHWGRADVAILPMMAMLGTAVSAPAIGSLADRIGWRKVIGWSVATFAISLLLLSVVPPNHVLFAIIGVAIGVASTATSAAGYIGILPGAFSKRLGLAFGLAMLGTGIGGFVMPIVAARLLQVFDWRGSYQVLAVAALVLGFIAHRIIFSNYWLDHGLDHVPPSNRATRLDEHVGTGVNMTFREALASYRFWLLAFVFFFVSCAVLGGFVHLAPFASDRGLSRDVAAQAAAVVGVGLAVSRVGIGAVLDRVFAPLVSAITFAIGAIAFYVMTTGLINLHGAIMVCALLLGLATGSEGDLIPYLARSYFGKRELATIYCSLFGASTLGGAVGPWVYGAVFDHFHSYEPIHLVSAAICAVAMVSILMLGRYPEQAHLAGERSAAIAH